MQSDMRLYVLCGGFMKFDLSALRYGWGMGTRVEVPTLMFLVKHPRGHLLFETGLDPIVMDDPVGYLGRFGEECEIRTTPAQAIVPQLAALGLTPKDIDYVAMSCLYFDHTGGLKNFGESTLLVQRDEVEEAWNPSPGRLGTQGHVYCMRDLEPTRAFRMMFPHTEEYDVFGDGRVILVRAPCHARGEQALVVRLPRTGTVLMPAGVLAQRFNVVENDFAKGVLPGRLLVSPDEAVRNVLKLKRIAQRESATVLVHHDMDAWHETRSAPEFYD